LYYYKQAALLAPSTISTLLGTGIAYRGMDEYEQARGSFEQGASLANKSGSQRDEAVLQNELALTYWLLGEYPKALEFAKLALPSVRRLKDQRARRSV
jgi:tetratricopeptide (TPR) repeat protein